MKTDLITALPITPEDYEVEHYSKVDYTRLHSEMAAEERRFINGLIRWYRPTHILEIGVCEGGGSVNILNAVDDMPGADLTSIDCVDFCWNYRDRPLGFDVMTHFTAMPNNWNLVAGKDVSEAIENLSDRTGKFDFAVIDTGHAHPIEALNFLCILPFLNDGAIVVLQDTSLFIINDRVWGLAPRILLSSVVAEKLKPKRAYRFGGYEPVKNIVAFQVTKDTRKYISNVFESLMLPWERYPKQYIGAVSSLLQRYYPAAETALFDKAAELNEIFINTKKRTFSKAFLGLLNFLENCSKDALVFYGAGNNMKCLLEKIKSFGVQFVFPIWDINAENIGTVDGIRVSVPDFEKQALPDSVALITIKDENISIAVKRQLATQGYLALSLFDIDTGLI